MKKILILLLSNISNFTFAQYSDYKEYGIKGNIKIVKQYTYNDIISDQNEYKIKNNEKWNSLKIIYFSKKGTIDSIEIKIRFKDDIEKNVFHKNIFSI